MRDLRNGMLVRALTRAAHHQEIAPAEGEGDRLPSSLRSKKEHARRAYADRCDERLMHATCDVVAMPRDTVATIAIERDAQSFEARSVARIERDAHLFEHGMKRGRVRDD